MLVRAKSVGFFGSLRQVGDEFEVPDDAKGSWFSPVNEKAEKAGPKAKADKKTDEDGNP